MGERRHFFSRSGSLPSLRRAKCVTTFNTACTDVSHDTAWNVAMQLHSSWCYSLVVQTQWCLRSYHRRWKIVSYWGGGGWPARETHSARENFTPEIISGDEIANPQIKCFRCSKLLGEVWFSHHSIDSYFSLQKYRLNPRSCSPKFPTCYPRNFWRLKLDY